MAKRARPFSSHELSYADALATRVEFWDRHCRDLDRELIARLPMTADLSRLREAERTIRRELAAQRAAS
jgi:hypothetical protein